MSSEARSLSSYFRLSPLHRQLRKLARETANTGVEDKRQSSCVEAIAEIRVYGKRKTANEDQKIKHGEEEPAL